MTRTTALLFAALLLSSCGFRNKPAMYLTVSNGSGDTIRNVEVNYPGGTYGVPSLANGSSNRRNVALSGACKVTVKFETKDGKQVASKPFELGQKCPPEILVDIDSAMNVSAKAVQR